MDTIPGIDPMENPPQPPLAGLDPADLLKQGAAEDTFMDGTAFSFHPPTIDELAALFPQFEILELIGKGGMGAVYKVRQKELDRIVALKILPPAIGETPGFAERFAREAKALAKLNHPGIVTIHEFGQQDGLYFILMEFVDGVNLAQLMRTGRISPREALAIVPQICDALQFAHDQGIVHRDIKPENLLIDRLGRVKVADFGIAKVVASVCEDPIRSGDTPVPTDATIAGKIIGTPQYMAPEQIDHPSDVDHRADIYALGVVFYQMLTGELPGKELQAPSQKVRIDVRLDEIVMHALEKNPELRYQHASLFKTSVETVANSPSANLLPELLKSSPARIAVQEAPGQPANYPQVGEVTLFSDRLVFSTGHARRTILLTAVRGLGQAVMPGWYSPAGHRFCAVEFDEDGIRRKLTFLAGAGMFRLVGSTLRDANDWIFAIKREVKMVTGNSPEVIASPAGIPLVSRIALMWLLPVVLGAVVYGALWLSSGKVVGSAVIAKISIVLLPLLIGFWIASGVSRASGRRGIAQSNESQESPLPPLPKRGLMRRWRWVFLVMIPLGMLLGLMAAGVMAYVMPKKYEAEAIVEVRAPADSTVTPAFFGSQFEAMKSPALLAYVSQELDLPIKWNTDEEGVIRILKGIVNTQNIRGTDLITLKVRHTNPEDAVRITKAVIRNYQRIFGGEVIIHETPEQSRVPVYPDVTLLLMTGTAAGLLLSPLMAFLLIPLLQKVFPEKAGELPDKSPLAGNGEHALESEGAVMSPPLISSWLQSLIGLLLVLCLPGALVVPYYQGSSDKVWHTEVYEFRIPGQVDEPQAVKTLTGLLTPYQGIALKVDSSNKKWSISATDADRKAAERKLDQACAAVQRKYDEGKTSKLAEPIVWESRGSMSSSVMTIESRPSFIANLKRSLWIGLLLSAAGVLCLLVRRERGSFRFGNPGRVVLVLVMLGCFGCLFIRGPYHSLWGILLFGGILMGGSVVAVALGGRFMRFEFWMVVVTWASTVAFLVAGLSNGVLRLDRGWRTVPVPFIQNGPQTALPVMGVSMGMEPRDGRYLDAVLEWLGEIDAGRYEKAWSEAAAFARSLESPVQWATKMNATRTPLGKVLSRARMRTTSTSVLSGAPGGKYLIYVFQTGFDPGPRMLETVTLMFEKDGNWRVMGYSIEKDSTSPEKDGNPATREIR
ncbi:MAG: protein kinase [Verrucomicrobiota bacterium]